MARDIVFFLAPDDETAAATYPRGPGAAFESVTCHFIEPDTAVAEWGMYFEKPTPEALPGERIPDRFWPRWVIPVMNDAVEILALPQQLTQALAGAGPAELEGLAARWTASLRAADGDDITGDDLPAVLTGVARLAVSAVGSGGGVYSWSF
ncbi:MAG TPA: hypothetical protein VIU15_11605 [Streptomyces sp.]